MKLSLSTAGIFALAATVSANKKPCSNKCLRAIVSDTPLDVGQAFCSSFLSIEPLAPVTATATVTVTRDEVVTTTHSTTETTTTVTTEVTTGTTVTTITGTVTQFAKRAQASSDPASASILSVCKAKSARISRICSSFLTPASAITATSTLTVEETATQTTVVEYTTTAVETTTTTDIVTATSAAVATQSVSIAPIIVGDFGGGGLAPWVSSAGETGGRVEYISAGNVCVDTGSNCHQSAICRMTAPITGARYVAISQTITATPSTTYKLSILWNTRYGGANGITGIQALYRGADLGTYDANKPAVELYFKTISAWEFTTDSTGVGKIEIRVLNRGGQGGEYNYLDDIMVTRKSS